MAMEPGRRHLVRNLLLVTVTVAGLLSMHGLDGAATSLAQPDHSGHGHPGAGGHELLGLCVFVAVASLGVAAFGLPRRTQTRARFARNVGPTLIQPSLSVSGRSRLVHLCVLRL